MFIISFSKWKKNGNAIENQSVVCVCVCKCVCVKMWGKVNEGQWEVTVGKEMNQNWCRTESKW